MKWSDKKTSLLMCLQRVDLSVGEHSQTLPGLKLSTPFRELWNSGREEPAVSVCVPPTPSLHLPVQMEAPSPSCEASASDPLEPSTASSITIPRPQGRKTPELGSVLAPPMSQSRSKPAAAEEGGTTLGGQEFRQALSMTTDDDLLKPTKATEDSIDLLSLLDPLSVSAPTNSNSSTTKLLGSYPEGLPPIPLYPPLSLNPFAPSLQDTPSQMNYSPVVSRNPFSVVTRPPPGPYRPAPSQIQSFSPLPGLYTRHSAGSSMLPAGHGRLQPVFPPGTCLPHTLCTLAGRPSTASVPQPVHAEADDKVGQDPFEDLLTMAKPKKKVDNLRSTWETFD